MDKELKEILVEQVEFLKDQVYQKDETIKYLQKLLYGDKHNKNRVFLQGYRPGVINVQR